MGYRFGERKYSEGLYSRWPDWWHDKSCRHGTWAESACAPQVWRPVGEELVPTPWSQLTGKRPPRPRYGEPRRV